MFDAFSFLSGFEIAHPFILGLAPLPWLVYRFINVESRTEAALIVPFYNDLPLNRPQVSRAGHDRVLLGLLSLCWFFLLAAACAPQWRGEPVSLPVSGRDTLLAVDLSASMEIEDLVLSGRYVNRLEVIKDVVSQFIERRKGDRVGLVLFGTQAYLQTPLTFDTNTVSTLMDEATIGIAGEKTAIGDAIGLAVRQLRKRHKDQRVLILLTDGANTAGNLSPEKAATLAKKEEVTIYTVGVGADELIQPGLFGTPFGARKVNPSTDLDEELLQKIAMETGGRYFRARSTEDLQEIYSTIDRMEPIEQEHDIFRPVTSLFYWPLTVALMLAGGIVLYRMARERA